MKVDRRPGQGGSVRATTGGVYWQKGRTKVNPSSFRRILVVEDNPDGREVLRTLLELLGHEVQTASDGVEGVAKALAFQPQMALIDIGLPRLDGYQVAR